jgi:hypothetical protein
MPMRKHLLPKASRAAMAVLDNIILIAVYVVVGGYFLGKVYRFVADAVSR